MRRDPFDDLGDNNPLPQEALPPAPMAVAERIIARRRFGIVRWPGWVIAAAVGTAVLIGGGVWLLWTSPDPSGPLASDPSPTTEAAPSTAVAPAPVSSIAYFYMDEQPRPSLVPVPRNIEASTPAEAAVAAVLGGVTREEGEADPGLITFVPPAAAVTVVSISDQVVTLEVSPSLADPAARRALAQLVFTLTRLGGITGVRFQIDGLRYGVVAGSHELVPETEFSDHPSIDDPATRRTFQEEMSLAMIETPAYGSVMTVPGTVSGVVNSVGNRVVVSISDKGGNVLWQQTVQATCGTPWSECRGESDWSVWQVEIPSGAGASGSVYLTAAAPGSGLPVIGFRSHPVVLSALTGPEPTLPPATSSTTTTTAPIAEPGRAGEVAVYFLADHDASHTTPGPTLIPAMRTTAILSAPVTDLPRTTLEFLLIGPYPGELQRTHPLSTAIPSETRLLDMTVEDRIATVDLSTEFLSGGGTLSMRARLAQVVFTLTRFPGIDGVRFEIDGVSTTVFGGEGVIVGDPVTRGEFQDLLPVVMIEEPPSGGLADVRLVVRGTASIDAPRIGLALTDSEGLILWEGTADAVYGALDGEFGLPYLDCENLPDCRGTFETSVSYSIEEAQAGSLIAWTIAPDDGRQLDVREHQVWLTAGSPPAPGPDDPEIAGLLSERADLDAKIAGLRAEAADIEREMEAAAAGSRPEQELLARQAMVLQELADLEADLARVVNLLIALGYDFSAECSASAVEPTLPEEPDLPSPVVSIRAALFEAAIQCDWTALEDLAGDALRTTFGQEPADRAREWIRQEALHREPMRWLAETIRLPAAADGDRWVWPSAFAYPSWDQVPEVDRQALVPLYGTDGLTAFADWGGFYGYRVGITAQGDWQFFVVGD